MASNFAASELRVLQSLAPCTRRTRERLAVDRFTARQGEGRSIGSMTAARSGMTDRKHVK